MTTWTKERTLEFIDIFKSEECLWMIKSKDYMNKIKRDVAYTHLVDFVKTFDVNANKDTVTKKIANLRTVFKRELKKITTKVSGAGADEVYEPKIWYFQDLMFLKDQETPRGGVSNMPGLEVFPREEQQLLESTQTQSEVSLS